MKQKIIEITCETKDLVDINDLQEFQNDLKFLHKNKAEKLKSSIEIYGITFPGFVWKSPNGLKIIDSHQRVRVIKIMLKEGWKLKDNLFPVVFIKAKTEKEAKKKVLLAASMYGETTDSSLHDFLSAADLKIEDIMGEIDIPYIDIDIENKSHNFDDLDEEMNNLDGLDDTTISIIIPKKYKDDVENYLANGEKKTGTGLGKGVLKRCGLL